ncbi:MAG: phosphotransferase [Caldilineaceae bacterium]
MLETAKVTMFIEQTYATKVVTVQPLALGDKQVYRAQCRSGQDWVLRVYPPTGSDSLPVNLQGLVSVLEFLAQATYPAERVVRTASDSPIALWDERPVLVTTFSGRALTAWQPAAHSGGPPPIAHPSELAYAPEILFALSKAVGQLHCLQPDVTLPRAGMLPSRELNWAATLLAEIEPVVPPPLARQYAHLVTAVQTADRYEDLPFTLIHNDCNPSNVVITPTGQIALIDWESAGRGPALIDIGILLSNCFSKAQLAIKREAVAAIVEGYCQVQRLSEAELERLPDAIRFFRLVLLAGYFPDLVQQKISADDLLYGATYAQWQAQYNASDEIAALACTYFRRYL